MTTPTHRYELAGEACEKCGAPLTCEVCAAELEHSDRWNQCISPARNTCSSRCRQKLYRQRKAGKKAARCRHRVAVRVPIDPDGHMLLTPRLATLECEEKPHQDGMHRDALWGRWSMGWPYDRPGRVVLHDHRPVPDQPSTWQGALIVELHREAIDPESATDGLEQSVTVPA